MRILDASVAIKWFVADEERSDEARSVLKSICDNPKGFAVPELFFTEMFSVLWRVLRDEKSLAEKMRWLEELGLSRIGHGSDLFAEAARICGHHGIAGYDAIYAATASLCRGAWLTADERAHRALAGTKLSVLL